MPIQFQLSLAPYALPTPYSISVGLVTARCMLLVKTDVNMEYFMPHRADSRLTLNLIVPYTFILRHLICCTFLFCQEMFFLRFAFCIFIKKLFCTLMSLAPGGLLHIDNCAKQVSTSKGCKKSTGLTDKQHRKIQQSFGFVLLSCSRRRAPSRE